MSVTSQEFKEFGEVVKNLLRSIDAKLRNLGGVGLGGDDKSDAKKWDRDFAGIKAIDVSLISLLRQVLIRANFWFMDPDGTDKDQWATDGKLIAGAYDLALAGDPYGENRLPESHGDAMGGRRDVLDIEPGDPDSQKQKSPSQDPLLKITNDILSGLGKGREADLMNDVLGAMEGDIGSIAKLGKVAIDSVVNITKNQIGGALEMMFAPLQSQRAGEVLSQFGGGLEKVAGGVFPQFQVFGTMTKVAGESVEALRKWNTSLFEANRKFAEFSGAMAAVSARQEVRDLLLARERGERRGDFAEQQASTKHELEKSLSPWEDTFADLQAGYASQINLALTNLVNNTKYISDKIDDIIKKDFGMINNQPDPVQTWIDQVGNDPNDGWGSWGRPRSFR